MQVFLVLLDVFVQAFYKQVLAVLWPLCVYLADVYFLITLLQLQMNV